MYVSCLRQLACLGAACPGRSCWRAKQGFQTQKPTVLWKATVQAKKKKNKKPSNSSCEKPFNHFYSTTKACLEQ